VQAGLVAEEGASVPGGVWALVASAVGTIIAGVTGASGRDSFRE
jgi:hypothetical protein